MGLSAVDDGPSPLLAACMANPETFGMRYVVPEPKGYSPLRRWLRAEQVREAVEGPSMPPFPSEDHGQVMACVVGETWARGYHVRFHFYGPFVEPPTLRIPLDEADRP